MMGNVYLGLPARGAQLLEIFGVIINLVFQQVASGNISRLPRSIMDIVYSYLSVQGAPSFKMSVRSYSLCGYGGLQL